MASSPDIILRAGKPAAVILDIKEYEDLLERAEDAADLNLLRAMRKRDLSFKSLSTHLNERNRRSVLPRTIKGPDDRL